MTLRVEVARNRFDKRAQTALDQAKARRIVAEARADLEAARAARSPQDAELYLLAVRSLVKVDQPKARALQPNWRDEHQAEIARVFGGVNG